MKIDSSNYLDKLYGGWLGKVIGVRHGAFIEGMTYDEIRKTYGKIDGYPHAYKRFAADDDTNGPTFFIRALSDYDCSENLSAENIGNTWLNYAPFEHGFYWWGGYGVSTEHTAYLNLRSGIRAPLSGSMELNGTTLAEQIGGQIFIDCWGLVAPGNPDLAARLAEKAASVSHDGNGKWGGVFIAACISLAFVSDDILWIIKEAQKKIPRDLVICKVIGEVTGFHSKNPDDWEECFAWIKSNHGYDKYPGVCHIVPNLAVVILALLYGNGDFSKTINLCGMCGWDTDCNAGNAGTILGVMTGSKNIPRSWTEPVNDQYVCSSVMGSMNIVDIPSFVYYLASLAYPLQHEAIPACIADRMNAGGLRYDFTLPGSRHGIHVQTSNGCIPAIDNSNKNTKSPENNEMESGQVINEMEPGLLISDWAKATGDSVSFSFHTYFTPADFDDNRSNPAFSPIVYPGAEITAEAGILRQSPADPADVYGNIFVDTINGRRMQSGSIRIGDAGTPGKIKFQIPFMESDAVAGIGISFRKESAAGCSSSCPQIHLFSISTKEQPHYSLDFARMGKRIWTADHVEIDQFTRLKGSWDILDGKLSGSCYDFGEIYTGHYQWSDYSVSAAVLPVMTGFVGLNCRVQGAIRSYSFALIGQDRIAFLKNSNGYTILKEQPYLWECGRTYRLRIDAVGNRFFCYCNDSLVFEVTDDEPYRVGCVGFLIRGNGRSEFLDITVHAMERTGPVLQEERIMNKKESGNDTAKIVVAGSINMDHVFSVTDIPQCGETIQAHGFETHPGGKGANQAVAAARMGAKVSLLGCVGSDETGRTLLGHLRQNGVDTGKIEAISGGSSGMANIYVDSAGNNCIVVFPGANDKLDRDRIRAHKAWLSQFDLCIVQLETPLDSVTELIEFCKKSRIPVILNPSPAAILPDEVLDQLDYIIPNEHELLHLLGMDRQPDSMGSGLYQTFIARSAMKLVEKGVRNVIVTLGKAGAVLVTRDRQTYFQATEQVSIDSTGAGDCFLGAFSACLASKRTVEEAIAAAIIASGLSVTKKGAQEAMPFFNEVQQYARDHADYHPLYGIKIAE